MLSKIWSLSELSSSVRIRVGEITKSKLQSKTIRKALNFALYDVFAILKDEDLVDYKFAWNVSDSSSSASAVIVTGATYTDATKNIQKTTHGLTSSDIGKRISAWVSTTNAVIAEIASIVDVNNFTITKALGVDAAGTLNYVVFSANAGETIDISGLTPSIQKPSNMEDSISGILTPLSLDDFKAQNISDYDYGVYWTQEGESILIRKGDNISSWGTLTLHGIRQPYTMVSNTDMIDIRDKFVSLVLNKAVEYILGTLGVSGSAPST